MRSRPAEIGHSVLLRCALAIVLTTPSLISAQIPRYGEPAPKLAFDLLQGHSQEKPTLESLKGQAIALEFWATWCTGCVWQIPHLNALAEQFKDAPVRFISITDESDKGLVSR